MQNYNNTFLYVVELYLKQYMLDVVSDAKQHNSAQVLLPVTCVR